MTAIPLKRIEGCLVAKKKVCSGFKNHSFQENFDIGGVFCTDCGFTLDDKWNNQSSEYQRGYRDGYMETSKFVITQQGEVQITLNREKLAIHLCEKIHRWGDWKNLSEVGRNLCLEDADAILNALPELVEVVK